MITPAAIQSAQAQQPNFPGDSKQADDVKKYTPSNPQNSDIKPVDTDHLKQVFQDLTKEIKCAINERDCQ